MEDKCEGHECSECHRWFLILSSKEMKCLGGEMECPECMPNLAHWVKNDIQWKWDDSNGDMEAYVRNVRMGVYG